MASYTPTAIVPAMSSNGGTVTWLASTASTTAVLRTVHVQDPTTTLSGSLWYLDITRAFWSSPSAFLANEVFTDMGWWVLPATSASWLGYSGNSTQNWTVGGYKYA